MAKEPLIAQAAVADGKPGDIRIGYPVAEEHSLAR
jgi:hypothetical protein